MEESLEKLIQKCEKAKHQIILLSKKDKSSYDEDLFPRMLKDFLINIMLCMKVTPSIPSGNRFNNWWRLLWDRCTIHPKVHNWTRTELSHRVYDYVREETISWKLKYLALTIIHFGKNDISFTSLYLDALIRHVTEAIQFPIQLTFYQVILELFDLHLETHYDCLLDFMKKELGNIVDISDVDINPKLHLTDMDQYCRIVLNSINRESKHLMIFSVQCAEANLIYKRLFPPVKNGKLWVDFNLKAKTITIICQRSCLRSERPSTDSEEFDDCTTEILTINFDNINKITAKIWGHMENPQGKLLSILLNKAPSYMYDSSCATVEQANKLFLNIEKGRELNKLLVILRNVFTTRFEKIRNKPERKVSQQNSSQNRQSNLSLTPYDGRSLSVGSLMSSDNSNLDMNTSPQVSVAHKEMLSLTRSGSTITSICQVQTTVQYVNPDNWPASSSKIVSNQNPNKGSLSLTTNNYDEDDSVIESSQENKPNTISTLLEKIDRTMDKFNPEPYNPRASTTTRDSLCKQRFDSSYKENQPVKTSLHQPSSAKNVMDNSMPKLPRKQPEKKQLFNVNKCSGNGPLQIKDRLKDIIVESDYDDESVISDTSQKSMIISGNLLNRSNIGRSLVKSTKQDSVKNLPTKVTPNGNTIPAKSEWFTQKQSQRSQETPNSGVHMQPKSPMIKFGERFSGYHRKKGLSQKTPMSQSQKSQESNSSNTNFQQRAAKRNNPFQNWNSQNRKPDLNKSLYLSSNDSRELFERNNMNNTAESILDSALGVAELPKKLKLATQNNSVNDSAVPSTSQCDVLLSSQKSRTPEAVSKRPLHYRPLSVQTPENALTKEIRDILRTLPDYSLPETPTYITPTPGIPLQSARSQVSVPASICTDTQVDTVGYDASPCSIEDDHSGELVIDLDAEPVNDKHDTDDTINAPVPVQPTVRRKRGRPSKSSKACDLNTDYASDGANSTAHSINSTIKSKRRQKKRKNKCDCDCDPTDEVNYTTELPTVQNKDEEAELKRLRRFSTKTRFTKPPIRYTDELNKSYLQSVKGEIRRKRESGYLTDTVVYRKTPSRHPRRADATLQRLSQTLDVDPSDYRYETDLDTASVERATQSDAEVGGKHRKKKKNKSKRARTEYDSSLINMNESIRLRLSRRNSSCELLTQDSVSQGEPLQCPEAQESRGWGTIFNKLPVPRKTNTPTFNGTEPIDESKRNKYSWVKDAIAVNKMFTAKLNEKNICESEEEKEPIRLLFAEADSFMSPQQIRETLKKNYGTFLPSE